MFYKTELFSNRKTCDTSYIKSFISLDRAINSARENLQRHNSQIAYIYELGETDDLKSLKEEWSKEIHYLNLLKPACIVMK